jgi:hypothetical protein
VTTDPMLDSISIWLAPHIYLPLPSAVASSPLHRVVKASDLPALIARVRADERARWSPPPPATPGHVSYCWCPTCGDPCAGLEEKR